MKMLRTNTFILTLTSILLFDFSLGAKMDMKMSDSSKGYRVVVAPVVEKYVPLTLEYIGNMKANNRAALKARVTGDVMDYHFQEGDYVEEGQLLFTIDPRPYEAILQQAVAKLEKDKAELVFAEEQVARYHRLADEEFISVDAYDGYVTQAAVLQATVAMDRAALALAELNLSYCEIRAPFSGQSSQRLMDPGNLVESRGGASDPTLVVINQIDPIKVIFAVPETDLILIKNAFEEEALSVEVITDTSPQQRFEGELWLINNEVNVATNMIMMQGIFENPQAQLWPGQFVKVHILMNTKGEKMLIPSKAISRGQSGPYVYIVDAESKAELRPIEIGQTLNGETIVNKGLKPGERVVVEGQTALQSGVRVNVGNP